MNTDKKPNTEEIEVTEEQDGSVTVELPEGMEVPEPEEKKAEGGAAAEDDGDEDSADDTDAVRQARRARRRAKKDYIKRTNEEKDQRLQLLQRQNQELMERLANVERKTYSADMARFDKAIEDEELRFKYAAQKIKEATDNSDGDALIRAQEIWYDSRKKLEGMLAIKQKSMQSETNQNGAVNPRLQRHANEWMENNPWFDPNAKDEDSQIAKVIDNRLSEEGWDPSQEDYWEELDKRLRKRLPHRYTDNYDEQPRRRPRSFVTGSEREQTGSRGGGSSFVLSPEQVRAMKDAGLWDDPQARARMIKRYAQEARNNRS